jgi:hypothetical protein
MGNFSLLAAHCNAARQIGSIQPHRANQPLALLQCNIATRHRSDKSFCAQGGAMTLGELVRPQAREAFRLRIYSGVQKADTVRSKTSTAIE